MSVFVCTTAFAQEPAGHISERIQSAFALVIGNSADLAIPLTRRALQRRSAGDRQGAVEPMSYSDTGESSAAASDAATTGAAPVAADDSTAGSGENVAVARLPRPRPARTDKEAGSNSAGPLDLVAGAAAPRPRAPAAETTVAAAAPATGPASAAAAPDATPPADDPSAPATTAALPAAPAAAADQPILAAVHVGPQAPELIASGSCLAADAVTDKDGDFKRNADSLAGSAFCIAETTFKERKRQWTIETVKTSRPGPVWAVMHDDEDMSFDNAVWALKTYGGTLIAVDTGGRRNEDGIDPNRNFSADGVGCSKLGTDATPQYTTAFRDLFTSEPIIALHNNSDGQVPTGGLGHVSMASIPKEMQSFPAVDPKGPLAGEKDLVLLVSLTPVTATAASRAEALGARGINAMIERVKDKDSGDCSLSNYAVLTGHPDYLNITVDHGESDRQRGIIDAIMSGRSATVATQ